MCIPHFDSPSVFARTLDINKGGYFSIRPLKKSNPKQGYIPSTNVGSRLLAIVFRLGLTGILLVGRFLEPSKITEPRMQIY